MVLSVVALVVAAWVSGGCGSTCQQIATGRSEFLKRHDRAAEPHLAVALPFQLINRLIAERMRGVRPKEVRLPARLLGGYLFRLAIAPRRVRIRPAREGHLGYSLEFDLMYRGQPVSSLNLDMEVRPEIDPRRRVLEVAIRPDDLRAVRPRLAPGAAEELARSIHRRLPGAARLVLSRKLIRQAAQTAVTYVGSKSYELLRDTILRHIGPIARLRFAIDQLPVADFGLRSVGGPNGHLLIQVQTTLPVGRGLEAHALPMTQGGHALRIMMAGATVAELANWAMATGRLPARYDQKGKPSPDGEYEPALGWEPGRRPLKAYVWRTRGKPCVWVRLGATPRVRLAGHQIELRVDDGTLEELKGPAWLQIAAWFYSLGADAITYSRRVAASARFTVAGKKMRARITNIGQSRDTLTFDARLTHVRDK